MSTVIRFNGPDGEGGPMSTYVVETPQQILEVWRAADGSPFMVTHEASGRTMYVNPQNVTCWFERPAQEGGGDGD